jgi:O-methyltransferase
MMLVPLLRQIQMYFRLAQLRDNPQKAELANHYFEGARLGIPPRANLKLINEYILQNRIGDALEVAERTDFDNIANVNVKRFLDFSAEEKILCAEARHVSLTTPQAVVSLARAVRHVIDRKTPGAFVECGVFKGGSIIVILRTLLLCGVTDRDIYLFDTFEGMPEPDENDIFYTGDAASALFKFFGGKGTKSDWVRADLDSVRERVLATGYPRERIHFVKGMVEDTLPQEAPEQVALLRLDTDFYKSTKHELVHLYPRISRGGILILDDYGVFRGAQQATDEYFRECDVEMFLTRVDEAVRLGVKL